ncbi:MAG: hypothetical protein JXA95_15590 [Spirochaetales bacterium]|nr:hypothetical protein [Spirochaetales bacterium]
MTVVDSTLREGEQTPGLVLSFEQKRKLADALIGASVNELEAGIPAMGEEDRNFLRSLNGLGGRIICWCRSREEDVRDAFRTGTGAVHVSFPVSDCQLELIGRSWDWMLNHLHTMSRLLKGDCSFLSAGAMDASRCAPERLREFVSVAAEAGFMRIRLADTVGIMTPGEVREWAFLLKEHLSLLEFHGHNDLGMATANSLTALQAGFGSVSATLLGLGERAGNAPLEEVLLAARLKMNWDGGISLAAVSDLARLTARMTGETIPPTKPLLGERINRHESGIHVAGLRRNPASFRPYDPTKWNGPKEEFLWGRHSGRHGVEGVLRDRGFTPEAVDIGRVTSAVKELAPERGGALSEREIVELYLSL